MRTGSARLTGPCLRPFIDGPSSPSCQVINNITDLTDRTQNWASSYVRHSLGSCAGSAGGSALAVGGSPTFRPHWPPVFFPSGQWSKQRPQSPWGHRSETMARVHACQNRSLTFCPGTIARNAARAPGRPLPAPRETERKLRDVPDPEVTSLRPRSQPRVATPKDALCVPHAGGPNSCSPSGPRALVCPGLTQGPRVLRTSPQL